MKQKVWLVTGVSKGLGREIALAAAEAGHIVLGTVRNEKDKATFEEETGGEALIADLSRAGEAEAVIAGALKRFGVVDVLVNNAGYGAFGMIEEFTENEIRAQFDVNFLAVWKLCQAVLPSMRQRKTGTIVQISSRLGLSAGIGNGIYAATKFALEGMSEALKLEVAPFGIKVLLVEPGAMKTDFFGASVRYAANGIGAYTDVLGDIRKGTRAIHGNQKGNPRKAARLIVETVIDGGPDFRLPVTSGTIETMESKSRELRECAEKYNARATGVDE